MSMIHIGQVWTKRRVKEAVGARLHSALLRVDEFYSSGQAETKLDKSANAIQ